MSGWQNGGNVIINGCQVSKGGAHPTDCSSAEIALAATQASVNSGNIVVSSGATANVYSNKVYGRVTAGGTLVVNVRFSSLPSILLTTCRTLLTCQQAQAAVANEESRHASLEREATYDAATVCAV